MFKIQKKGSAATEAIEYRVAGATLTPGMVVKYSSGKLVVAVDSDVPEYVTLGSAKNNEICPVKRIYEDEVYETKLSASGVSLHAGDKVTLHASNGLEVTATTGSGVFEIIELDGTAVGSKVRGLFRR